MPRPQNEKENLQFVQELAEFDGPFESPININFKDLNKIELPSLAWNKSEVFPKKWKLTNTGHTVILSGKWKCERPYLTGGPLEGNYVFSQIHFHWGSDNCRGSEHSVCGEKFPLEMHVAHFKTEYLSQESALREKDGMVVLVYLFKLQDEPNFSLKRIISSLSCIRQASSSTHLDPRSILSVCNPFTDDYFMYWGSVVTSSCAHILLWIICREPFGISKDQLEEFRKILDSSERPINRNNRDTQPLHCRNVFHVNPSRRVDKAMLPIKKIVGCFCHDKQEAEPEDDVKDSSTCCCAKTKPQEEIEGKNNGRQKSRQNHGSSACSENRKDAPQQTTIVQYATIHRDFSKQHVDFQLYPQRNENVSKTAEENNELKKKNEMSESCCFLPPKDIAKKKNEKKRNQKVKKKSFDSAKALSNIIESLEALRNHTYKKLREFEAINEEIKELKQHCSDPNEMRWIRRVEKIMSRQKRFTIRTSQCCFNELRKLAKECNIDEVFKGKSEEKIYYFEKEETSNASGDHPVETVRKLPTTTVYSLYKQERFSRKAQKLIRSFFEDIKENEETQRIVRRDLALKRMSTLVLQNNAAQVDDQNGDGNTNKRFITQQMFNMQNLGDRFFTEVTPEDDKDNETTERKKYPEKERSKANFENEKIIPLHRTDVVIKFDSKSEEKSTSSFESENEIPNIIDLSERKEIKKKDSKMRNKARLKVRKRFRHEKKFPSKIFRDWNHKSGYSRPIKSTNAPFSSELTSDENSEFTKRRSRRDISENQSSIIMKSVSRKKKKKYLRLDRTCRKDSARVSNSSRDSMKKSRMNGKCDESENSRNQRKQTINIQLEKEPYRSPERKKLKLDYKNGDAEALRKYNSSFYSESEKLVQSVNARHFESTFEYAIKNPEIKSRNTSTRTIENSVDENPIEFLKALNMADEEAREISTALKTSSESISRDDSPEKPRNVVLESLDVKISSNDAILKAPLEFAALKRELKELGCEKRSRCKRQHEESEMKRLVFTENLERKRNDSKEETIQRRTVSPVLIKHVSKAISVQIEPEKENENELHEHKFRRFEKHEHKTDKIFNETVSENVICNAENQYVTRFRDSKRRLRTKRRCNVEKYHFLEKEMESLHEIKVPEGQIAEEKIFVVKEVKSEKTISAKSLVEDEEIEQKTRTLSVESLKSAKKSLTIKKSRKSTEKRKKSNKHLIKNKSSTARATESGRLEFSNLTEEEQLKIISENVARFIKQKLTEHKKYLNAEKKENAYEELEEVLMNDLKTIDEPENEEEEKRREESATSEKKWSTIAQKISLPEAKELPEKKKTNKVRNFIKRNKMLAGKYKRKNLPSKGSNKKLTSSNTKTNIQADPIPVRIPQPIKTESRKSPIRTVARSVFAKNPPENPKTERSVSVLRPSQRGASPSKIPREIKSASAKDPGKLKPSVPLAVQKIPKPNKRWVPTYTLTSYLQAPSDLIDNQQREIDRYRRNDRFFDREDDEFFGDRKKLKSFTRRDLETNDLEYLIRLEMCISNEIATNIENSMNYVKSLLSQDYNGTAIIEKPPIRDSLNIFETGNSGVLYIEMNDYLLDDCSSSSEENGLYCFYRRPRKNKKRKRRFKKKTIEKRNDSGDPGIVNNSYETNSESDLDTSYSCEISITLNSDETEKKTDPDDISNVLKKYIYHLGRGEESNIDLSVKDKLDESNERILSLKPQLKKRNEKISSLSLEMKKKLLEILEEELQKDVKADDEKTVTIRESDTISNRIEEISENSEMFNEISEMVKRFLSDYTEIEESDKNESRNEDDRKSEKSTGDDALC